MLRSPLAVWGGRWAPLLPEAGRGRLQRCSLQTPRLGLTSPLSPSHHDHWSNQLASTSTSATSTTPLELSATGLQSPAWWSRGELLLSFPPVPGPVLGIQAIAEKNETKISQ